MIGVPSWYQLGSIHALAARTATSGDVQRQATLRSPTFAGVIWSSGEYLPLAYVPAYVSHSPRASAAVDWLDAPGREGAGGWPTTRVGGATRKVGSPTTSARRAETGASTRRR